METKPPVAPHLAGFCSSCGKAFDEGDRFCANCGKSRTSTVKVIVEDAATTETAKSHSSSSQAVESVTFEADIKQLDAAIERKRASFEQLTTVIDYLDDPKLAAEKRNIALDHYSKVLAAFEQTHGRLTDIYYSSDLECYLGQTVPVPVSSWDRVWHRLNRSANYPPERPQFHFLYDLSKAGPDGGLLLSRMQQLAFEAPRFLSGQDLSDWVDRLYSTATDLAGVLEPAGPDESGQPNKPEKNGQLAGAEPSGVVPNREGLLAVIKQDLDALELRYIKTPARALYFKGAIVGVGVATFVTLFGLGYGFDNIMVQMWMAGAIGAMLSVMQRLNDDKLDVQYEVGPALLSLTASLRPILGGFAGFLTLLLVLSRIVPLPVGTGSDDLYLVVLAFAAGFAERSIPDIISKAQSSQASTPSSRSTAATG